MLDSCKECDSLYDADGFSQFGIEVLYYCRCGAVIDEEGETVPAEEVNLELKRSQYLEKKRWAGHIPKPGKEAASCGAEEEQAPKKMIKQKGSVRIYFERREPIAGGGRMMQVSHDVSRAIMSNAIGDREVFEVMVTCVGRHAVATDISREEYLKEAEHAYDICQAVKSRVMGRAG